MGMLLHRHLVGAIAPAKPNEEVKPPVLEEEKVIKEEVAEQIAESEVKENPKATKKTSKKASK